jgi:predicted N-acetyltransferase YhbS
MTALSLTPLRRDDLAAVVTLSKAVNWPHRRADIELLMGLGTGRALRHTDGTAKGVGMWWPFGDDRARLGRIIVEPELQGRGHGRALVEALLQDLAPRSAMLLATDAGRPLYRRLGFVETGSSTQHQGAYQGVPLEGARLRPATQHDIVAIARLDAEAFGTDRRFTLSALLAAGRGAVLEQRGTLIGYGFERVFGRGSVVGPIVAADQDDAIILYRALARPGFVRVDTFDGGRRFADALESTGLTPLAGSSPVMVRGTWPASVGPRVLALASHALG